MWLMGRRGALSEEPLLGPAIMLQHGIGGNHSKARESESESKIESESESKREQERARESERERESARDYK